METPTKSRRIPTPIAALVLALGTTMAVAQTTGSGATSGGQGRSGQSAASTSASGSANRARGNYSGMRNSDQWERTHRASKIIGIDVVTPQGEKVGEVEDIVLDDKGGIAYAVVSTGGFLGIGDKLHAVPWRSLQTNTGRDNFVLDVDKDRLKAAPGFERSDWPNVTDPKWTSENRKYFPESGRTSTAGGASRAGRNMTGSDVGTSSTTRRESSPAAAGTGPNAGSSRTGESAGKPAASGTAASAPSSNQPGTPGYK